MRLRVIATAISLLLVVSACGDDDASAPTNPATTSPVTTSPVTTSPATTSPATTSPATTSPATTSPPTTSPPTTTTTTRPATAGGIQGVSDLTIEDLEEWWEDELQRVYDIEYEPVTDAFPYFPSTGNLPGCGSEPLSDDIFPGNAFYCRPGDFVAWDAEELFPDLYVDFGDFAVSLVLAHEWGHVVQERADVTGPTIMTELQADCFAGAWTAAVDGGESELLALAPGDLEEAMAGYLLFRDPVGTRPDEQGAHGSAFDRVNAFRQGFQDGAERCRTYEDGEFSVAFIPVDPRSPSGDLFVQVGPAQAEQLLVDSLEAFWGFVFPEIFGSDWTPVTAAIPYAPSVGEFPTCGDRELDDGFYLRNIFYCAEDDFVAWDDEILIPSLVQSIGDFAVGQALAHEWATAAQVRAGLSIDGVEAELQADCFSGVYTAVTIPDSNPTGIILSAGDLDEAVAGFLQFSDDPEVMEMFGGSAFERFDAFQAGFFATLEEGLAAGFDVCLTP